VFLEPDLLTHTSFAQMVNEINLDNNYLNGTRMDQHIQYAQDDPFDAHLKICSEMAYR
jgi:hypothetical protein